MQALLDAGADLTGKTHLDELAYSLNGENIHYGTPVNPACPDRIPGGSSSGSAVSLLLCVACDVMSCQLCLVKIPAVCYSAHLAHTSQVFAQRYGDFCQKSLKITRDTSNAANQRIKLPHWMHSASALPAMHGADQLPYSNVAVSESQA